LPGGAPQQSIDFLKQVPDGNAPLGIGRGWVDVRAPWARIVLDRRRLKGGWWRLECAGEAADTAEVRLRRSDGEAVVMPVAVYASAALFLPHDCDFEVDALISPWPGRYRFESLRLVRLSRYDEARLLLSALSRAMAGRNPVQRILAVAGRLLGGHAVGIAKDPPAQTGVAGTGARPRTASLSDSKWVHETHGDLSIFRQAGDELHPDAVGIVRAEMARRPELIAVYADVERDGAIRPVPGWDPVLANAYPYGHSPLFVREGSATGIGSWADLTDLEGRIGSVAVGRIALPLARSNQSPAKLPQLPAPALPRTPRISIIIPTKTRIDLLETCLAGLAERTDYPDMEVIVVDNGHDSPGFPALLQRHASRLNIVHVIHLAPFNFPDLIDAGARRATGEILLLLNDDAEPVEPDWLRRMAASALEPGVGAVGARLLYPGGDIQHAGVALGAGGPCGHRWRGLSPKEAQTIPAVVYPGLRSAVTGACLAVRRELYDQMGGLDAVAFPVAYNDIDFCLRLNAAGHRTVYRGDAVLIHHESQSRGSDGQSASKRRRLARETAAFIERWGHILEDDPYDSPAFDPVGETGNVHPALSRSGEWRHRAAASADADPAYEEPVRQSAVSTVQTVD